MQRTIEDRKNPYTSFSNLWQQVFHHRSFITFLCVRTRVFVCVCACVRVINKSSSGGKKDVNNNNNYLQTVNVQAFSPQRNQRQLWDVNYIIAKEIQTSARLDITFFSAHVNKRIVFSDVPKTQTKCTFYTPHFCVCVFYVQDASICILLLSLTPHLQVATSTFPGRHSFLPCCHTPDLLPCSCSRGCSPRLCPDVPLPHLPPPSCEAPARSGCYYHSGKSHEGTC